MANDLDRLLGVYSQPVRSWPGEEWQDEEARANLAAINPKPQMTRPDERYRGAILPFRETASGAHEWAVPGMLQDVWDSARAVSDTSGTGLGPVMRPSQMRPDEFEQMMGHAMAGAMTGMAGTAFGAPAGAVLGAGPTRLKVDVPGVRQALSAGEKVDPDKRLLAIHNSRPETLATADRMGGLPAPSMAVTMPEMGFDSFGNISLIYGPGTIKPGAKSPVYSGDGYTSRHPPIETRFSRADERAAMKAFHDPFASLIDGNGKPVVTSGDVIEMMENLGKHKWDSAASTLPALLSYAREAGLGIPDTTKFSARDVQSILRRNVDPVYGESMLALQERARDLFPDAKERLFLGWNDNTGNKMYKPYTAQNAVKAMSRGAGGEDWFGPGQIRAVLSPQFSTLKEIQGARGRIMPRSEFEPVSDALMTRLGELSEMSEPYWKWGKHDNPFMASEARMRELVDVMRSPNWYFRGREPAFDQLPPSIMDELADIRKQYAGIGTEYFEAKPHRVVPLSEAEGAIVDQNTPRRTVEMLRDKHGIDRIETRPSGGARSEGQKASLKKFSDFGFSAIPIATGVGALTADDILAPYGKD